MSIRVGTRGPGHLARVGGGAFAIGDLFSEGAIPGFDFTDLDPAAAWGPDSFQLLRQDNIGQIVTASGQNIGAILDKSLNLTTGAELVTNGDFASATGWTMDPSWVISGGKATNTPSGGNADILRTIVLAVGEMARCQVTVSGRTAGALSWTQPITDTGNPTSANGIYLRGDVAPNANQVRLRANATFDGSIDDVSVRKILGYGARQSTSGARPVYTASGALKYILFDGSDDHLLTNLAPAAAMTICACFRASAGSQNVIGSTAASNADRCYLALDSAGKIAAGWGSDSPSTINGGSDITGTDVVAMLRANASVVELWLNGSRVYQAAPNGSPNTTIPMAIGARNVNGTIGANLGGRIYRAAVTQQFIPDAWVQPLMQLCRAGVV